ncbi:MAG: DUF1998 domain-containing protein [Gemmatimonadota bacterium]|nr:DUF1998 domain-containing protein [Gemmatimonadota bacterium]
MAENFIGHSQLITTYGPGSMIDLPDYSVIVSGLQDWSFRRREKIEETRLVAKLCQLLDVPSLELYTPPRHEENNTQIAPIGARIFPTWFIVRKSAQSPRNDQWRQRRLVRWDLLQKGRFIDEDGRRQPVVPVRFVCGCRRGHINDLDWRSFVHKSGNTCQRPLWLEERGTSGDISDIYGVCDCGEERALYEALDISTSPLGQCSGNRPWIGQYAREKCTEPFRLLVRTASNAYFPQVMSVISLPEFDAGLASTVERHYERLKTTDDLNMLLNFRAVPELNAAFDGISDETVIAEYERQKGGGHREDVPVKIAEFEIFNTSDDCIGENDPRSTFHAETLPRAAWDPESDLLLAPIDNLVLVHRLREVMALLGFTRFEAVNPDKDGEIDLDVTRAALAETITWLPAVENRGEGVFVSFKKDEIEKWVERPEVQTHGRKIEVGWQAWAEQRHRNRDVFPGLPFIMRHSFSHMLMTSIALDCGYPATSLRERVYAGDGGFGILIYTGSSDSEGTLGGLVEAGRRFTDHLRRALRDNLLCSNDPVCAEHAPDASYEGRPLLGAACHGCLLISETSCEQRNDFLDRALVIPTVASTDAAFFDPAGLDP